MAELAEALCPEAESLNDAVENLLHRVFPSVARQMRNVFVVREMEISKGLTQLFGLTDDLDQRLQARRDRAGRTLGRSGNDSLRRSRSQKELAITLILRETTAQLAALGSKSGFLYSGRYVDNELPDYSRDSKSHLEQLLDTAQHNPIQIFDHLDLQSFHLARSFLSELERLRRCSIYSAYSVPTLAGLAICALHTNASVDLTLEPPSDSDLRTLLCAVIDRIKDADYRTAAHIMFSSERHKPPKLGHKRRAIKIRNYPLEPEQEFTDSELLILDSLARKFTELAWRLDLDIEQLQS
jgi:hypothetical protein